MEDEGSLCSVSLFGEMFGMFPIKVKRVVKIIFYYLKKGEEEKETAGTDKSPEFSREGVENGEEARKEVQRCESLVWEITIHVTFVC